MQSSASGSLVGYLPPLLADVRELAKICALEQPLFDTAKEDLANVQREQFAVICGEYGLSRWEAMLKITPREGADEEERTRAVLFRLNEQLPFTLQKLEMLLGLVSPENSCELALDYDERRLDVGLSLYCKPVERLITEVLHRTLPANILCVLQWKYNTHTIVGGYTHEELAERTYYAIREEVFE